MVVGYICLFRKIFYHIVKIDKYSFKLNVRCLHQFVVKYFEFSSRFRTSIEQKKTYRDIHMPASI
jgi:hypothetical protein